MLRRNRYGIAVAILAAAFWVNGCGGDGNGDGAGTTTSKRSAGVILLRQDGKHGQSGLEVMLVHNSPRVVFSPGAWVFPSKSVDSNNGGDATSAAADSLAELGGIEVDAAELVLYSEWMTPPPLPLNTRMYLALAPAGSRPTGNGSQTVDAGWFEPQRALDRSRAGNLPLSYATTQHLKSLVGFANAAHALKTARSRKVEPIELRVVTEGGKQRYVLPDQLP